MKANLNQREIKLNTIIFLILIFIPFTDFFAQEKKLSESKYKLYINLNYLKINAPMSNLTSSFFSQDRDFNLPYETGEEFNLLSNKFQFTHKFTPRYGINIGLMDEVDLLPSIKIYYGFGLMASSFEYSNVIDTTEMIIGKVTVLDGSSNSPKLKYDFYNTSIIDIVDRQETGQAAEAKFLSLHLPIGISYRFHTKISLNLGASLWVPIVSEMLLKPDLSRIIVSPGSPFPEIFSTIKSSSTFYYNNIIYNGEASIQYQISDELGVTANYAYGLNSLIRNLDQTDFYKTFGNAKKSQHTNFGIGIKWGF
ncbi:MAG: hypothetical protein RLZZ546_2346 [Bacteroidota bacterium]